MISLQEYIYYNAQINEIDESYYPVYINIFKKIDIYNRNTKLINEGYTNLHNNIIYNSQERQVINIILENYMNNVIYSYVINEKLSLDGAKKFLTGGKDKIKELVQKFKDIIPKEVIEAYELLIKCIKNGIKDVKDLITTIGKLLTKLGDNIVEALEKLKLFNDEFCSKLPETNSEILGKIVELKNDNQKKLVSYIISNVKERVQDKNKSEINESKEKVAAGILAGTALFSPGIAILAGGGFGLYKLLKYVGPKLSEKLEPYLLSDKTKEFANNLYNNKFAKYAIGLQKQDDNKDESKLKYIGKILWSIFINFVIATLVTTITSLFVTSLIGSSPLCPIIIASIIGTKNIFKIVINRILNFKKETIAKDGKIQKHFFFDMLTMIGILSSIMSILVQIPAVKEWLSKTLNKIYDSSLQLQAKKFTIKSRTVKDMMNVLDENYNLDDKSFNKICNSLCDIQEEVGSSAEIYTMVVEPQDIGAWGITNQNELYNIIKEGGKEAGHAILDKLSKEAGINLIKYQQFNTFVSNGKQYIIYYWSVNH